jgi:hypothetical protein
LKTDADFFGLRHFASSRFRTCDAGAVPRTVREKEAVRISRRRAGQAACRAARAGGACARAAHAYITRTEEYDEPERDGVVYSESDHMPSWAQDDARDYWDAADLFERANGRLYLGADFHGREWMENARECWADLSNATLERCGRHERVDHRGYERQGIDREPGQHFGPGAADAVARGQSHDRLETAATMVDDQEALRAIEDEIARLEIAREGLVQEVSDRDEPQSGRRFTPDRSEPDRGDEMMQER